MEGGGGAVKDVVYKGGRGRREGGGGRGVREGGREGEQLTLSVL